MIFHGFDLNKRIFYNDKQSDRNNLAYFYDIAWYLSVENLFFSQNFLSQYIRFLHLNYHRIILKR